MKRVNLTEKQIKQIKDMKSWSNTLFHGNRKKVGLLPISDYLNIISKKKEREIRKIDFSSKTDLEIVRSCLNQSMAGNSVKVMITGETGIYLADPVYKHKDYNKTRLFDKTPRTLNLMRIFNKLVN